MEREAERARKKSEIARGVKGAQRGVCVVHRVGGRRGVPRGGLATRRLAAAPRAPLGPNTPHGRGTLSTQARDSPVCF